MIAIFIFIAFAVVTYILLHGNIESLSQILKEQTGDKSGDEDLVQADQEGEGEQENQEENDDSYEAEIDDDEDDEFDILNDNYNEPGLTSDEEEKYGVELTKLSLSPTIESDYMSYHSGKMISDLHEDANEKNLQMVIFDQVHQSR